MAIGAARAAATGRRDAEERDVGGRGADREILSEIGRQIGPYEGRRVALNRGVAEAVAALNGGCRKRGRGGQKKQRRGREKLAHRISPIG